MVIAFKLVQPKKHLSPKLVTDEGIVMEVKSQPAKQPVPKLVTDDGMVTEVRLQPEKHSSGKLVTDDGMVTEANEQCEYPLIVDYQYYILKTVEK